MIYGAPLTWAERSVFLASMLSANPASYNAGCIVEINGALSTRRLVDAIARALIDAELLSLSVVHENGCLAWRKTGAAAPGIDLIEQPQSDPIDHLTGLFRAKPIRPDGAPLVFFHVLTSRPDHHVVMLRHHHVVLDFQGAALLMARVAAMYEDDAPPKMEDRRAEILLAERRYINSAMYHEDERYWRERMRGLMPGALANPATEPAPEVKIEFTTSCASFEAFAKAARAIGSTPFQSLLLSVYTHLVREREDDVVIGVPLADRAGKAINAQSRMLPFRMCFRAPWRRQEAAAEIRRTLKQDIERARFPVWENTPALFAGARRGALPRIALNFMRAPHFRFGAATGIVSRLLYGERNAETYIRCVNEADGGLSISLDSGRDRSGAEGLARALATAIANPAAPS